jgi:Domain of unknown function (DUF932)
MQINRQLDTSVGPKFLAVSNADLQACMEAAAINLMGVDGLQGLQVMAPKQGARRMWTLDLPDLSVDVPELGGRLTPRIWARNANDGSSSLSVGMGLFHWVCLNGCFIGVADAVARIRHVDGPNAHALLDALPAQVARTAERIRNGELLDTALDALEQAVLDPVAIIGNLAGVGKRAKEVALAHVVNGTHRPKDQPTNAWGLYNLLNEAHRRSSRNPLTAAERDVGLLDNILILAQDQVSQVS